MSSSFVFKKNENVVKWQYAEPKARATLDEVECHTLRQQKKKGALHILFLAA